ncbi:MrcB family domain-containing protein [Falsiroseomonas sp. HC035]|uniref:MrcB family domain-containing protein n=1 Tax=Falsiroseomonas sp. HC035 TaxID=3390999 RepID=UPI003D317691
MKAQLQEIIDLQKQYSANNTPAMQRRGDLIRRVLPAELAISSARLARALGPHGADLNFEGRDGTGKKTFVPWVRFFSASKTTSAQEGWYCVYLFEATGRGVYLALAHGSTTFEDGQFKPKPAEHLAELVAWGRLQLSDVIAAEPSLETTMSLGGRTLSNAYERSTLLAKWYPSAAIPNDSLLYDDAEQFARLLRRIYDAEALGRVPHAVPPEVTEVQEAASGLKKRGNGQGFGLTPAERRAVEVHAMAIAKQHLNGAGWSVQDVSASRSYDFLCRKGKDEIIVEVKGTTTLGAQVVLTKNEVAVQRKLYPLNALIVVHSIILDRTATAPSPHGGTLAMLLPWKIEDQQLSPLAFTYALL